MPPNFAGLGRRSSYAISNRHWSGAGDEMGQYRRRQVASERADRASGGRRSRTHHAPGKPVAKITAVETARKRIEPSALRAMTDEMPLQHECARDLLRRMRDEDRY